MYHRYFKDWQVKTGYKKEFVSLWAGWLGKENIHKLDEVTESEWQKFNNLIVSINENYILQQADHEKCRLITIKSISSALSTYAEAMNKDSSKFSNFVINELDCIFSESWDYTYIIWYKEDRTITELSPLIQAAGLFHFP